MVMRTSNLVNFLNGPDGCFRFLNLGFWPQETSARLSKFKIAFLFITYAVGVIEVLKMAKMMEDVGNLLGGWDIFA